MTDENLNIDPPFDADVNNSAQGEVTQQDLAELVNKGMDSVKSDVINVDADQAAADKAAVEASGLHHLQKIVDNEINETLKALATKTAQAIGATERALHWTHAEVLALWSDAKTAL